MEDNWNDCSEGRGKDDSGVISSFSGRWVVLVQHCRKLCVNLRRYDDSRTCRLLGQLLRY